MVRLDRKISMARLEMSNNPVCPEIQHTDIFYGSKILSVDINVESYTASLRFGNRSGFFIKKKPEETTEICIRGDSTIQQTADSIKQPITLRFDTANSRLKLWALSVQDKFGFTIEGGIDDYRITVSKEYTPQTE
jgi:hypothetical protein